MNYGSQRTLNSPPAKVGGVFNVRSIGIKSMLTFFASFEVDGQKEKVSMARAFTLDSDIRKSNSPVTRCRQRLFLLCIAHTPTHCQVGSD